LGVRGDKNKPQGESSLASAISGSPPVGDFLCSKQELGGGELAKSRLAPSLLILDSDFFNLDELRSGLIFAAKKSDGGMDIPSITAVGVQGIPSLVGVLVLNTDSISGVVVVVVEEGGVFRGMRLMDFTAEGGGDELGAATCFFREPVIRGPRLMDGADEGDVVALEAVLLPGEDVDDSDTILIGVDWAAEVFDSA
jgi:hypothetical protein